MSTPLASRYTIRGKLGEGGMAEVLEAVAQGESGFTRRVAIKRLRRGHDDDPSFSRMFLDEARIASRLHHGGIVAVLDYGVVDETPFQVLEYVDGENARALAGRGKRLGKPMPLEVALHLVTEVARALHYAHTCEHDGVSIGIVHRDVKPANILVSRTGDVKLADFGIAFATERSEKTQTGVAKGTPGFMAPEQILGAAVDARTDIFSLGCTLHALAFGASPLAGEGNLERLLRGEPLSLDDGIDADVAAIVRRATDPMQSRRYATAAEMANEVGAALTSRLRADAKGALLQWLEAIGEEPTPRAALDALLLPQGLLEQEGGSWRFETTRRERPAEAPAEVEVPAAPKRRLGWIGAIAAVLGIAIAGGLGARLGQHRAERAEAQAASVATADPAPSPSAVPVATLVSPEPEKSASPIPTRAAPHRAAPLAATARATAAPPSNVVGTLAVRGGAYRGASIVIDGRIEPYGAPHYFDLPVGTHRLELRVDGGTIASGDVDILPDHTPTQPRYWP